jgi:hypothetical protein
LNKSPPEFFSDRSSVRAVRAIPNAAYVVSFQMQDLRESFFLSFAEDKVQCGAVLGDHAGAIISRGPDESNGHSFFDEELKRVPGYESVPVSVISVDQEEDAEVLFSGSWADFTQRSLWRDCLRSDGLVS